MECLAMGCFVCESRILNWNYFKVGYLSQNFFTPRCQFFFENIFACQSGVQMGYICEQNSHDPIHLTQPGQGGYFTFICMWGKIS